MNNHHFKKTAIFLVAMSLSIVSCGDPQYQIEWVIQSDKPVSLACIQQGFSFSKAVSMEKTSYTDNFGNTEYSIGESGTSNGFSLFLNSKKPSEVRFVTQGMGYAKGDKSQGTCDLMTFVKNSMIKSCQLDANTLEVQRNYDNANCDE